MYSAYSIQNQMSYKIISLGVQKAKLEANPINNTTHSTHSKTFGMLFTYTQSNGFHWMGWRLFIIRNQAWGNLGLWFADLIFLYYQLVFSSGLTSEARGAYSEFRTGRDSENICASSTIPLRLIKIVLSVLYLVSSGRMMSAQECPSPSLQVTIICRKSADETTEISRSSTQRRTGKDSEFSGRVSSSPAACVLLWRRRRRGVGRHRMNSHRSHAGERDNGPRQDNAVALCERLWQWKQKKRMQCDEVVTWSLQLAVAQLMLGSEGKESACSRATEKASSRPVVLYLNMQYAGCKIIMEFNFDLLN